MRGSVQVPEVSLLIRQDNKILFVLREKTGYADGMYCLPGGHVEADEQFSVAACRETLEEVNVQVKPEDIKPVHVLQRIAKPGDIRIGVLFEALHWSGEPTNMEPERHGPLAWFDADNLPYDKIMEFQREALRSVARNEVYSEFGWQTK